MRFALKTRALTAPVLLLASLTGCSQCAGPTAAPDAAKAAPTAADAAKATPDPAPDPNAPDPAADPKAADASQLFPPQPGLPKPLEGFAFDLDRAAVVAKFPGAETDAGAPVDGFPGVVTRVHFFSKEDAVRFAALKVTDPLAEDLLRRWGEGTALKGPGGTDHFWLAPSGREQFVLAGGTFAVWPVLEWQGFLGEALHFGFERPERLLLGATAEQVMSEYAHLRPRAMSGGRMELRFPPQPLRTSPSRVRLTLVDDKVVGVRVKLFNGKRLNPRTAMHKALALKYGVPKTDAPTRQTYEVQLGPSTPALVTVNDLEVGGVITVDVTKR